MFSIVIGAALALNWSWRSPYLILSAIIVTALAIVAWPVDVPESPRHGEFTLRHLGDRDVFVPWLHIINAVFSEFAIGVWAATYLKEVGHAGGGQAAALAGVFGVMMFLLLTGVHPAGEQHYDGHHLPQLLNQLDTHNALKTVEASPAVMSLLSAIFKREPERITMRQVSEHPFFTPNNTAQTVAAP